MREAELYVALRGLGIAWTVMEHAAVFTVEECEAIHSQMPGKHTKNLFLKDAAGRFWLTTVEHAKRVDLKALATLIGAKKLSFGHAKDMEALLGVSPGAVTPLAAFNDIEGRVRVVIDADLSGAEAVNVHPLRNTATIGLQGVDLLRALVDWAHEPVISIIPERA